MNSYYVRAGRGNFQWNDATQVVSGTLMLIMQEADGNTSLDEPLVRIFAFSKGESGDYDKESPVGKLEMTVRQVV